MSIFEARGTRRPHSTGHSRGPVGRSDIGDTVGPGDGCMAGVVGFFKGLFLIVFLIALVVAVAIIAGGGR